MLHVIALYQIKLKKVSKLIVLKDIVLGWLKNFTWKYLVDKIINLSLISQLEAQNYWHVAYLQEGHSFFGFMLRIAREEAEV